MVILKGCGFSVEKYNAIPDKNVVVKTPIAVEVLSKGKKIV